MEQDHIMIYWLVAGIVFLFAEVGLPGVGLLFVGCGALTVGMLLNLSLIASGNTLLQAVIFFAATAAWVLVLWKPMQKLKLGKHKTSYNNMIGDSAVISEKGLDKTHGGEVIWSGTIMKAKLDEHSGIEILQPGTPVIIKNVVGNTLVITPK